MAPDPVRTPMSRRRAKHIFPARTDLGRAPTRSPCASPTRRGSPAARVGGRPGLRRRLWILVFSLAASRAAAADLSDYSLEDLLNISVTGASKYEQRQTDVAAAVQLITRDQIRSHGWRTLGEALSSLPGFYLTYDRQYQYLGVRGFGTPGDLTTRVLVTINGIRENDSVYDAAAVGNDFPVDLGLVERIEVIPGPGSAVYGQNAMFAVINVVTRNGAGVGGAEVETSYQYPQATLRGRASLGKVLDNGVDLLLSASALGSKGEDLSYDYGAAGVSGVARGLDGERGRQVYARLARDAWSYDLIYGERRKDDPAAAFQSDPLTRGQYQQDTHLLTQVQYQDRLWRDDLQFTGRVFVNSYRFDSRFVYGGGATGNSAASDTPGGELRLVLTAWQRHKLMVGMEYLSFRRQALYFRDEVSPGLDFDVRRSGDRLGLYLQDEWQLTDRLTATLGARYDTSSPSGRGETSPRAALVWQASGSSTVKILCGRAFRAPNTFERDYGDNLSQAANPVLASEHLDTAELVLDQRFGPDLRMTASAYSWRMKNRIVLGTDPVSGLPQYQTGPSSTADGAELSADKVWSGGTRLRGSVGYQDTRNADGSRLPNSPRVMAKLNASSPLPVAGLRVAYEVQYYGARNTVPGAAMGGYTLSNLRLIAAGWAPGLELAFGVYNLFDVPYQHPASPNNWQHAFLQDGRSVRLDALIRF